MRRRNDGVPPMDYRPAVCRGQDFHQLGKTLLYIRYGRRGGKEPKNGQMHSSASTQLRERALKPQIRHTSSGVVQRDRNDLGSGQKPMRARSGHVVATWKTLMIQVPHSSTEALGCVRTDLPPGQEPRNAQNEHSVDNQPR